MEFVTKSNGRELTVKISGELDHYLAEKIRGRLDELVESVGLKRLIFDFSELNFMDSTGIGLLLGRYRLAKQLGIEVFVADPGNSVRKILDLSGITNLIPVINSRGAYER